VAATQRNKGMDQTDGNDHDVAKLLGQGIWRLKSIETNGWGCATFLPVYHISCGLRSKKILQ